MDQEINKSRERKIFSRAKPTSGKKLESRHFELETMEEQQQRRKKEKNWKKQVSEISERTFCKQKAAEEKRKQVSLNFSSFFFGFFFS